MRACHLTIKAAERHGLGDTLAINPLHAGWQKNYSHTHWRKSGGVCDQGLSMGWGG